MNDDFFADPTNEEIQQAWSTRARIIKDFSVMCQEMNLYPEFFESQDLGVPLSILVFTNSVELKERGIEVLRETWHEMCKLLKVSEFGSYEKLEDMLLFVDDVTP